MLLGLYPVRIPADGNPPSCVLVPELMVPLAITVMALTAESVAAELTAMTPALPDVTTSPADIETVILPASRLNAWMPKSPFDPVEVDMVAFAPTFTVTSPVPPPFA